MTRIEKINLIKQVKAGLISLKKIRTKWWSQDWSDPTLFHCAVETMYSTDICPTVGIPARPGEIFRHLLYYHADIQFNGSLFLITDEEDEYKVLGNLTLYRQSREVTIGRNFGLYLPNEKFDSGFIF